MNKSNDRGVPKDEIQLAKLVQNAKARGLKWTKGAAYRDKSGKSQPYYSEETYSCCAIGAALLNKNTKDLCINTEANDVGYTYTNKFITGHQYSTGQLLGLGFRLAMK
jgi:hypothetical protein